MKNGEKKILNININIVLFLFIPLNSRKRVNQIRGNEREKYKERKIIFPVFFFFLVFTSLINYE